jgi:hypothetical protein
MVQGFIFVTAGSSQRLRCYKNVSAYQPKSVQKIMFTNILAKHNQASFLSVGGETAASLKIQSQFASFHDDLFQSSVFAKSLIIDLDISLIMIQSLVLIRRIFRTLEKHIVLRAFSVIRESCYPRFAFTF